MRINRSYLAVSKPAPTGPRITSEPRLYRARDHCRRALKHYRAADQSPALFDFHRIGKKQKYKAYHSIGLFAFLRFKCGKCDRGNGFCWGKKR